MSQSPDSDVPRDALNKVSSRPSRSYTRMIVEIPRFWDGYFHLVWTRISWSNFPVQMPRTHLNTGSQRELLFSFVP